MGTIIEIPLDSGNNDAADSKLLPDGVLKVVQNMYLRRDGQLEVRPGDQAVSMTDREGETVNVFELANLNDRLLALGDGSAQGFPTDVYQYVPSGGVASWFGTRGPGQRGVTRIPPAYGFRDLVTAPDQAGGVLSCQAASYNGVIVMAWSIGTNQVYVRAFREDGTTLAELATTSALSGELETIPRVVVTATGTFWVIFPNATGDLLGLRFTPATDAAFTAVQLVTNASAINNNHHAWTACAVEDAAAVPLVNQIVVSYSVGSTITLDLLNGTSGAVVRTYTGPAVAAMQMASFASGGAGGIDRMFLIYRDNATSFWSLYQRLVSTTAGSVGPTAMFSSATTNLARAWPGVTIDRRDTTRVIVTAPIGTGAVDYRVNVGGIAIAAHTSDYTLSVYGNFPVGSSIVSVGSNAIGYSIPLGQQQNWLHLYNRDFSGSPAFQADVVPLAAVEQSAGFYPTTAGCVTLDFVTGKVVWARVIDGNDGERRPQVSSMFVPGTPATARPVAGLATREPRKFAVLASQLHVAGGMPIVFDGAQTAEQGFIHRPVIQFAVQGTSGSLTPLAAYSYVVTWEWADASGRLCRSQPSTPLAVTLTGANDDATITVTTPIGLRVNFSRRAVGQNSVRVVLWRTVPNAGNFHRVATVAPPSSNAIGQVVEILDTMSDANASTQEVLYTQSQTTLPHVAAEPHDRVWAAGDALLAGRLPAAAEWVRSKRLFPAEPVEWAERSRFQFRGCTAEDIESVAVVGESNIILGRRAVDLVSGQGPDVASAQGEFFPPLRIADDGGGEALLRTSFGLFYAFEGRLFLLPPGGGEPQWVGFDVQDTLDAFPDIRCAVYLPSHEHAVFACNSTDGTAGVLLRFDLRRKVWYTHTVPGGVYVRSLATFAGRLAWVTSSGVVRLADSTTGSGTELITCSLVTGSSVDFGSLGYGAILKIGLLVQYMGPCTLQGQISYDDGRTFEPLGTFDFTSGFVAGQHVPVLWTPARQRTDRFVLQFNMAHSSVSPQLRLNKLVLEVEKAPGTTRLGASSNK